MRECYLDNAATTRVYDAAARLMNDVMLNDYGNPSSLHKKGFEAEQYLRNAAKQIAGTLKASEREIVFTSGGTEANNMALLCGAESKKRSGRRILSTRIEHASVYQPLLHLAELGYDVEFLPVDSNGILQPETLRNALTQDTILVSVMAVNNEIGSVMPIADLASVTHGFKKDILFHSDAIQAYGKIPIIPKRMGIDLMSVSGHKLHGPKGSGFLYIRDSLHVKPLIYGGGQQRDLRSGTENVPAVAGFGAAVSEWFAHEQDNREHMYRLKELMISEMERVPGTTVNGVFTGESEARTLAERVRMTAPHIVSVSFAGVRSEVLLHALAERGIYVSSGSACSSNHPAISGTLTAIGVAKELLDCTLRFSFCETTTEEDVIGTVDVLAELVPVLSKFRRS
ncbi:MAG: cysteine desulfurase [Lachnospiraceae bacterium]|nr:cysteine desulfurase [Lachnospiraceae bacterium]